MTEIPRQIEGEPEEADREKALLDILEPAFEQGARVELSVSEPSGELRSMEVLIEGFEKKILFVSKSKEDPVMGISIGDVRAAKLVEKTEN